MIFNTVCRGVRIPKGYAYDHVGEHSPKFVSPLVTITKHGYTKHYFEGMNRICSKIGGGFDAGLLGEIEDTVPALACNYVQQSKRQNEGVNRTFADCLGMGAEVDGKYDLYKVVVRETERDKAEPAFYYHSDHLGSAAYLTNDDGKVTQTLNYLPYGEPFVNQRATGSTYSERFTFTGKERDEETGFGYFGARYMDHELMTMWLSVDPLSDKYPSISPYAYCAWNPVKLVDPDGREINPVYTREGDYLGETKEGFTGDPLIMNRSDYEMMMDISGKKDISELSVDDVKERGGTTFDDAAKRGAINGDAQEKIVKNIISHYKDPNLSGYDASIVANLIKYDHTGKELAKTENFAAFGVNRIVFKRNNPIYEFTVENMISTIVYHEWKGHMIEKWGNNNNFATKSQGGTHYKCYESVINSPIFNKTTEAYQQAMRDVLNDLLK